MKNQLSKTVCFILVFLSLFNCSNPSIVESTSNSSSSKEISTIQSSSVVRNGPPLININLWLTNNSNVANSIKWQFQPGSNPQYGSYYVTEADKISWPNWSAIQKSQLTAAFQDAYNWYFYNYANGQDPIPTVPTNQIGVFGYNPNGSAICYITQADAWHLYIRWMAHSLLIESYGLTSWTVTSYDSESLSILFDSSRMMSLSPSGYFVLGFDNFNYEPERKNLSGSTLISTPIYTYKFLKSNYIMPDPGIVATNKLTVIKNLLTWCSHNMTHFYNSLTFANANDHWQYLGPPPLAKIVEGTTAPYYPGFSHWTAGCGGTSSFLVHALRAVNIPVQMATICSGDHFIPLFPTEKVFMDHGDNPYNSDFTGSGEPVGVLLLNDTMFTTLFGSSFYSNLNDPGADCNNVGYTVTHLSQ